MEVTTRKRRHPLKNLSLKWSFMLYMTICVLVMLALSGLSANLWSGLQNDIYNHYDDVYRREIGMSGDIVIDGELFEEDTIWIYTENLQNKFSESDRRLYTLYGVLTVLSVFIIPVLCILITGILFYMRKMKKPLKLLDEASARIAGGELDFKVAYDSQNEFGRLAASFETMRDSLKSSNREMWRMMEERKRLNAAFAHDLRTPLTVLKGYTDFLKKYLPDGRVTQEKLLSTVDMMDIYTSRLEGYTSSMSTLQKLEEISPQPETLFFHDLCERLKSAAEMLKGEKMMSFQMEGDGTACADPQIVAQVMENLVKNAVRYAKSEVGILCALKETVITLTVSDDGGGFSDESLRRAVEPYYRSDKELADGGHFGLGLYICKLLCEKHGGSLTLSNREHGAAVVATFALIQK